MKKIRVLALTLVLALALALTGCRGAKPLPEGMDLEETGAAGRELATMLMEGDYQGVLDKFDPDMLKEYEITTETLSELMAATKECGAFKEITDTVCVGAEAKDFEGTFASVTVYCEHEEDDVIYVFSLDTDLSLLGFQLKTK